MHVSGGYIDKQEEMHAHIPRTRLERVNGDLSLVHLMSDNAADGRRLNRKVDLQPEARATEVRRSQLRPAAGDHAQQPSDCKLQEGVDQQADHVGEHELE